MATPSPDESPGTTRCQVSGQFFALRHPGRHAQQWAIWELHPQYIKDEIVCISISILINAFISCVYSFSSLAINIWYPLSCFIYDHATVFIVECHNSWRSCQGNGGQTSRGESVCVAIDIILSLSPFSHISTPLIISDPLQGCEPMQRTSGPSCLLTSEGSDVIMKGLGLWYGPGNFMLFMFQI